MLTEAPIERPEMTLPEAEADWVRAAYADAGVILEYGSGGSTVMAAEMPGKTIFSVESDKKWAGMMQDWFAANPPASEVHIVPVHVGPTKRWGVPTDPGQMYRWPRYPLKIWDAETFRHPDVVLIDGRFRAGCLLATLFRITRPVSVYFDDYIRRSKYRVVEEFAKPVETRGRMVRFDLEPTPIPPERLLDIMTIFTKKL